MDGPQLHDELKAQEVVGSNGLELQEVAESHQLRSGQVVQSQFVLKQFGELHDLLVTGTFSRVPDLQKESHYAQNSADLMWNNGQVALTRRDIHGQYVVSTRREAPGAFWSFPTNTNLLEEGGELLGHVALGSLVPQCNLLDGVL